MPGSSKRRTKRTRRANEFDDGSAEAVLIHSRLDHDNQPTNDPRVPINMFPPENEPNSPFVDHPVDNRDQKVPTHLMHEILLPLDLFNRSRLSRVNTYWDSSSLFDTKRLQYLDLTIIIRDCIRQHWNQTGLSQLNENRYFRQIFLQDENDGFFNTMVDSVRKLAHRFPMRDNGYLLCKWNEGVDYDTPNEFGEQIPPMRSKEFLNYILTQVFPRAKHLIFVDSVIREETFDDCLVVEGRWDSVSLVKSEVYCDGLCGHLIKPIYIPRHIFRNPANGAYFNTGYCDLLDRFGECPNKRVLDLLKRSLVHILKTDATEQTTFYNDITEGLVTAMELGFKLRNDFPAETVADVRAWNLRSLLPSTIYQVAKQIAIISSRVMEEFQATPSYLNNCMDCGLVHFRRGLGFDQA